MNETELKALLCASAVVDKKAERVKILDLSQLSAFTDVFVICSGQSERQVQAICDAVVSRLEAEGFSLISTEGYAEARWVLIDFDDVVVHVFLDSIRDYYSIESLWKDARPVAIPSEVYTGSFQPQFN